MILHLAVVKVKVAFPGTFFIYSGCTSHNFKEMSSFRAPFVTFFLANFPLCPDCGRGSVDRERSDIASLFAQETTSLSKCPTCHHHEKNCVNKK